MRPFARSSATLAGFVSDLAAAKSSRVLRWIHAVTLRHAGRTSASGFNECPLASRARHRPQLHSGRICRGRAEKLSELECWLGGEPAQEVLAEVVVREAPRALQHRSIQLHRLRTRRHPPNATQKPSPRSPCSNLWQPVGADCWRQQRNATLASPLLAVPVHHSPTGSIW